MDSSWSHCLHFCSLAYELTHRRRRRICKLGSKIERASKFEEFVQLFAINNKENSSKQKLQNCWMAKTLMNSYILCKNWDFQREFLRNYSVYPAQIFRDNEIVMLFQYSGCYFVSFIRTRVCLHRAVITFLSSRIKWRLAFNVSPTVTVSSFASHFDRS